MSAKTPVAGVCPTCGKLRYRSGRAAKHAGHRAHPKERLNAYRCGSYWHIGHPVPKIRRTRKKKPNRRRPK